MKLKRLLSAAIAGVLCLSLAACGNAEQAATESGDTSAKETIITLTENWEFSTGFYPIITSANSNNLGITYWNRNFYNTLVCYDANGDIQGETATDWNVSEDG
jgi:nickel transport system substrate-binding protein